MGHNKQIKNKKIFDYCKPNRPLRMDQADMPSERIKMVFRLSSGEFVNVVRTNISQSFNDFEFKEQGKDLTVSGYPPDANFVEDDVLAIVKKHDPRALKV